MIDSVKEILTTWKANNSDRAKLQHTYIVASVILLLAAGVVGLMNRDMGQNLLAIAVVSAGVFLANAVVWSLLQSAVLLRLTPRRQTPAKRKK